VLDRPQRPLFRPGEGGVDEGFGEIDLAAVPQVRRQALEQTIESATALPELKPSMARLVRRIARRQVGPRGAGAEDPQHAVEHRARIGPRSTATVGATAGTKRRFENGPLGVSQIHAARYDGSRSVVTRRVTYL
jgi:hypothetical protein